MKNHIGLILVMVGCGVNKPGGSGDGGMNRAQASLCGNGTCGADETCGSCPTDCGACPSCGDGACLGETCGGCPADCGACPSCGDGTCTTTVETCGNCPRDCGGCADCGDSVCNPLTENCGNCPRDCGGCPGCGDGNCSSAIGETCRSCPTDCGACRDGCGNGMCDAEETCGNCAPDCGACPSCGDGACTASIGETCSACPLDCGSCETCGNGTCESGENCFSCPFDCGACCGNGVCGSGETCGSCPADCGMCPSCGNGVCGSGETCSSCPSDCGTCPSCGNGVCGSGETCGSCPADCGACPTCGNRTCDTTETPANCAADCGCAALAACSDPSGAPGDCHCDEFCASFDDCCPDACAVCGNNCVRGCTPTGIEVCDGIDNDCDGVVDDGCIVVFSSPSPFLLRLEGSRLENAPCAALVCWQPPCQGSGVGAAVRLTTVGGHSYYDFPLHAVEAAFDTGPGAVMGTPFGDGIYKMTARESPSCLTDGSVRRVDLPTSALWAVFGGDITIANMTPAAREWVCQCDNDPSSCETAGDMNVDVLANTITPAGRAACSDGDTCSHRRCANPFE